jgi:hypothetical protein
MRDVFWLHLYPISKLELLSKGILPCVKDDNVKREKDEWILCAPASEVSEG